MTKKHKPEIKSEVSDNIDSDAPNLVRTVPAASEPDPRPEPPKFGTKDPAHRFHWHGQDINGNPLCGSGDTSADCYAQAATFGRTTCHLDNNPDFIEVAAEVPVTEAPPTPTELNKFYSAGHADGLRYFEDIKALILAWATEQNLSGGLPDVEALPFVAYARYNP